ncbi:MAG: hypothetical protein SGJ19_16015 [Planctomycetia bacterium]|nr:hypothetical protein [Planctomycetia bacterium]
MKAHVRISLLLVVSVVLPARAASFQGLGAPTGDSASYAYGVSSNGSVVVGYSEAAPTSFQAFRWSADQGIEGLGDLPGGFLRQSRAHAVSANGAVIVGHGSSDMGNEAFRWTRNQGLVGLGSIGQQELSEATSVSGNGSVVVGYFQSNFFEYEAGRLHSQIREPSWGRVA